MRGTLEAYMPHEITLYKARPRRGNLSAGYTRIGTAQARTEYIRDLITNTDGVDVIVNRICVFFFNDLRVQSGDYLSLPRDEEVREIISFDEQVLEEDDDFYAEVKVGA